MTVKHIVLVAWKPEISEEAIADGMKSIGGLADKIDGVLDVEWGANFTDRAGAFTHGAIVTMRDRDVLAAYGPHPAHQEVLKDLMPAAADLLVLDFEPS